jgi:hypothetical protein
MNEWIKCSERIPKAFEVVWIYWRDREVLLGCRTYDDDPTGEKYDAEEGWYSFADEKCRWAKWWQPVTSRNLDEPKPPGEK